MKQFATAFYAKSPLRVFCEIGIYYELFCIGGLSGVELFGVTPLIEMGSRRPLIRHGP
jgi:hypothetical protein